MTNVMKLMPALQGAFQSEFSIVESSLRNQQLGESKNEPLDIICKSKTFVFHNQRHSSSLRRSEKVF
ncbi:hypothetical protein O9993_03145 [Vibrio lentus]|nr:hypothetical protein [Vibrio lentus]